jgi:Tetratricopeptide repeat
MRTTTGVSLPAALKQVAAPQANREHRSCGSWGRCGSGGTTRGIGARGEAGWSEHSRGLQRWGRTAVRAKALSGAGAMAWHRGEYAAGRALLEESGAIWQELTDTRGLADALNHLGWVARAQGDDAEQHSVQPESLALWREIGDKWGIAESLLGLGFLARDHGELAAGRSLLKESLTLCREAGRTKSARLQSLNHRGAGNGRVWATASVGRRAVGPATARAGAAATFREDTVEPTFRSRGDDGLLAKYLSFARISVPMSTSEQATKQPCGRGSRRDSPCLWPW